MPIRSYIHRRSSAQQCHTDLRALRWKDRSFQGPRGHSHNFGLLQAAINYVAIIAHRATGNVRHSPGSASSFLLGPPLSSPFFIGHPKSSILRMSGAWAALYIPPQQGYWRHGYIEGVAWPCLHQGNYKTTPGTSRTWMGAAGCHANRKETEAMDDRVRSDVRRAAGVRALALVWSIAALAAAFPAAVATDSRDTRDTLGRYARDTLERYARDTWASFVAMTDEETGLPADSLHIDGTRSVQTSTTNIGSYLWSTLVAAKLGFISHDDAITRLDRTLRTLETMEHHEPSGQFFKRVNSHPAITLAPGGVFPIPAIGAGRRPNRSAPTAPTMVSRSSRGPTTMPAYASCRAGAGACLKPSCPRCLSPKSSGAGRAGRAITH